MHPDMANHQYEPNSSWIFYGSEKLDISKIQKAVDGIFSENHYSFYPEIEWAIYGYRPPDGYQVMGAWRHSRTRAFAFLLDNPNMVSVKPHIQLLLYITGDEIEIEKFRRKCDLLKSQFAERRKKDENILDSATRLEGIRKSKSFGVIMTLLSVFAFIINAFSMYLRKLSVPEMLSQRQLMIYGYLVVSVHFCALILLLIVICFLILFSLKYGRLVLKRF